MQWDAIVVGRVELGREKVGEKGVESALVLSTMRGREQDTGGLVNIHKGLEKTEGAGV